MKFAFIAQQKVAFAVQLLCRVLGVSRSGFYAWQRHQPAATEPATSSTLAGRIEQIHRLSRCTYGVRRVRAELRSQGLSVGLRRTRRLMRQLGLRTRCKRRFRATTNSRHHLPVADNVLARDFQTTGPNQAWVADITYIPTDQGWLYLATLVDLFSRRLVGWATSDRIDRNLVLDALSKAVRARKPPAGLVHHTDRGVQYACHDYQQAIQACGMTCSMSRKGDPWDNAVAETTFATIKAELVSWEHYRTRQQAATSISQYVEGFYNRARRHSTLGYLSPVEFELAHQAARVAA